MGGRRRVVRQSVVSGNVKVRLNPEPSNPPPMPMLKSEPYFPRSKIPFRPRVYANYPDNEPEPKYHPEQYAIPINEPEPVADPEPEYHFNPEYFDESYNLRLGNHFKLVH